MCTQKNENTRMIDSNEIHQQDNSFLWRNEENSCSGKYVDLQNFRQAYKHDY